MTRITRILIPILLLATCTLHSTEAPTGPNDVEQKAIQKVLAPWRLFHGVLNSSVENRDVVQTQWVQAIECLAKHSGEILDSETTDSIHARLLSAEIRRDFFQVIVTPKVHLETTELDNAINQAIKLNTKAASVKLLEFFSWAPEELPDLRKAKKKALEELGDLMKTEDGFRKAALEFSDGASASNGGEIGTVSRDQLPAPLWEALEATEHGLTRILSTKDGHFRFFVLQRYPPLNPTREMLEPSIRRKMMLKKSSTFADALLSERREKLGVTFKNPVKEEDIAAVVGERSFTLGQLLSGLPIPEKASDIKAVISRGVDLRIMEMMLHEAGVKVSVPPAEEGAALGRRAFEQLVRTKLSEPESASKIDEATKIRKEKLGPQPLWTFDVLRVKGVKTAKLLFTLFHIRHDAGPRVDLKTLGALITEKTGLEHSIEHFSGAADRETAALGPEIRQELTYRAQALVPSRPLHLVKRHQAVFVMLIKRSSTTEQDTEALHAAARQQVEFEIAGKLAQHLAEQCLSAPRHEPATPPKEN